MAKETKVIEIRIDLFDTIERIGQLTQSIEENNAAISKLKKGDENYQKQLGNLKTQIAAATTERRKLIASIVDEEKILKKRAAEIDKQVAKEQAQREKIDAIFIKSLEKEQARLSKQKQQEDAYTAKKITQEQKIAESARISAEKRDGYLNQLVISVNELEKAYYRLSKAELEGTKGTTILKNLKEQRAELQTAQAAYGKYSMNVGNYASATNMLAINLGQVMKEIPNFAISARIGIMSLTNNLPMLAEAFKAVRVQQQQMIAEGKAVPSMFSLITKSVFGLTGIMSIAMVLLQLFSEDIINWVGSLFKAEGAINKTTIAQNTFNEVMKDGSELMKTAQTDVLEVESAFKQYKSGILTADEALKVFNEKLGDNVGRHTDIQKAMETFNELAPKYIEWSLKMAMAESAKEKAAEAALKVIDAQKKDYKGFFDFVSNIDRAIFGERTAFDKVESDRINDRKNKSVSAAKEEADAWKSYYTDLTNEAVEFGKIWGITESTKAEKTKKATKIIVDSIDEIIAKLTHIDIGFPFDDFNKAVGESLKTWEDSIDLRLDMQMGMANRMKKISDDMAKEDSDAIERKLDKEKKAADESAKIEREKEQRKKKIKESFEREAQLMLASINDFANSIAERELQNYSQMIAGKANYDELYAQKKYELQYEAAKREKALGVFSTLVDTASAIIGYLADPGGVAGTILSIMAGTTGAIQTAAILSQPLPVPPTASTGSKISDTSTVKFHSGGVAGSTPDSPQRSEEITRTLLTTERVLSPQQTSIFDSLVAKVSAMGGSNAIVSGAAQVTSDVDRMYIAMSKALRDMPAPIMTWQEFERQQDRQRRLKNNAIIK